MSLDWISIDDYLPGYKVMEALVRLENGEHKLWKRIEKQSLTGEWVVKDGNGMNTISTAKKWIRLK